jgi:hypothetical protein
MAWKHWEDVLWPGRNWFTLYSLYLIYYLYDLMWIGFLPNFSWKFCSIPLLFVMNSWKTWVYFCTCFLIGLYRLPLSSHLVYSWDGSGWSCAATPSHPPLHTHPGTSSTNFMSSGWQPLSWNTVNYGMLHGWALIYHDKNLSQHFLLKRNNKIASNQHYCIFYKKRILKRQSHKIFDPRFFINQPHFGHWLMG